MLVGQRAPDRSSTALFPTCRDHRSSKGSASSHLQAVLTAFHTGSKAQAPAAQTATDCRLCEHRLGGKACKFAVSSDCESIACHKLRASAIRTGPCWSTP